MNNEDSDVVEPTQSQVKAPGFSGDEKALANVVISVMKSFGFRDVTRDKFGSVIGLMGPEGGEVAALFDGHIDTVPITGEWSVDPSGGEIKGNRLYGRGSTDMKGPVAAAICGVAAAGKLTEFTKQIAVSASVMEEVLESIALAHILDTCKPKSVVICEPASLELMIAQ